MRTHRRTPHSRSRHGRTWPSADRPSYTNNFVREQYFLKSNFLCERFHAPQQTGWSYTTLISVKWWISLASFAGDMSCTWGAPGQECKHINQTQENIRAAGQTLCRLRRFNRSTGPRHQFQITPSKPVRLHALRTCSHLKCIRKADVLACAPRHETARHEPPHSQMANHITPHIRCAKWVNINE